MISKTLNPTTLLKHLALVSTKCESRPTMNAHGFINYELEYDLNNSHILNEEEIIGILGEGDDASDNAKLIKEVDNVQIVDVLVNRVGFRMLKVHW